MRFHWLISACITAGMIVGCGDEPSGSGGQSSSTSSTSSGNGGSGSGGSGNGGSGGTTPLAYPESVLCPVEPHNDARCGPAYHPENAMDQATLDKALAEGLEAFRYAGKGGACVGCHAPDGYDLARVGYADADILRRAKNHVDEARADSLVTYVHAMRQKYAMTRLLHPARYRPEQPAFDAFEAKTPGLEVTDPKAQEERDLAFMQSLTDQYKLLWATGKIDSLAKAKQAYDEIRAVDLHSLRLGIPFDHLSEDGWHGNEHLSVFEWYPGIPTAATAGNEAAWNKLMDDYLANPTDDALWVMYEGIDKLTGCGADLSSQGDPNFYGRACDWMRLKYRSLQVVQHMMRHETVAYPDVFSDMPGATPQTHLDTMIHRYPIWEAGDVLRIAPLQRPAQTACFTGNNHPCTLLPPDIDATIHDDPSYEEARIKQSEVFQQSWFVMSWTRDPALLHESANFATFIGDYLESVMLARYDVHHAFVVTKTAVEKSAAVGFRDADGFRNGTGKIASVRTFSFKQLRNNLSQPPANDPRRATYDRMFANFARMWIYLIEDDLAQSKEIYDRDEVLYAVRYMRTWIAQLEGNEDPAINAAVLSIEKLAPAATELRSQQNRDDNPGTGLQPNGTWGEFMAPYAG
jgi:hypothetical protein